MQNTNAPFAVTIDLGERSYPILIGAGLLGNAGSLRTHLGLGYTAVVVSNTVVGPLYADQLRSTLETLFQRVLLVTLPDGEAYKSWETLQIVFDHLLEMCCDRKSVLFALGGGVVGDMTGFAAACFMRGVRFVQVPTTLLAQVDSSVGGKTGINHPVGKNMIGAFYQPIAVFCDLDTLASLPQRQFSSGLAEVIKYGSIADGSFLGWLEANVDLLLARDNAALVHAVRRSCEIKAAIVAQDERESGSRAVLNFGHTFGHAIEAGLGYGCWLHGEAVGCGMVMAACLSEQLGLVNQDYVERLTRLIARAGLPTVAPRLDINANTERYLGLMRVDKKSEAGDIRFVVIDGQSRATLQGASNEIVHEVLERCCA